MNYNFIVYNVITNIKISLEEFSGGDFMFMYITIKQRNNKSQ